MSKTNVHCPDGWSCSDSNRTEAAYQHEYSQTDAHAIHNPDFYAHFSLGAADIDTHPNIHTPDHSGNTVSIRRGTSSGEEDEEGTKKKNKDEDPRKFTGKPWSCVVVGTYPRRDLVVNPEVKFVVEFTVFNAGTKKWGYNDLDFVWKSGFRNEETKIQDFPNTIPSGGEVKLYATFIAPKKV